MLGHELRNPLAPILRRCSSCGCAAAAVARAERVIERQVDHLVRLVDDLLDVSRITRGKVELEAGSPRADRGGARGIEMASPLLEQRAPALDVEVAAAKAWRSTATGAARAGDREPADQRRQVQQSRAAASASSADRAGPTRCRLRVRDKGVGIARDMLPRIFDLFVQEPQALDRSQGGLGLGLASSAAWSSCTAAASRHTATGWATAASSSSSCRWRPTRSSTRRSTRRCRCRRRRAAGGESAAACWSSTTTRTPPRASPRSWSSSGHAGRGRARRPVGAGHRARPSSPTSALLDIGLPVMDGYELAQPLRDCQAPGRGRAPHRDHRLRPGHRSQARARGRLRRPPGQAGEPGRPDPHAEQLSVQLNAAEH